MIYSAFDPEFSFDHPIGTKKIKSEGPTKSKKKKRRLRRLQNKARRAQYRNQKK